ncbi:collagen alpha-2(IX) chain-like [Mya arenaria]|uniref:collagen alpha-2(IX) chain-like n=1 Tax=Mya arenaria TaxID=6604 RepID=UPI0022E8B654|nr:collagen alpha-2(IX) chain-like [Mya arenaria]
MPGPPGIKGDVGMTGDWGIPGIQGIAGVPGDVRFYGEAGPMDEPGFQEPEGEMGQKGPNGERGEQGDIGPWGPVESPTPIYDPYGWTDDGQSNCSFESGPLAENIRKSSKMALPVYMHPPTRCASSSGSSWSYDWKGAFNIWITTTGDKSSRSKSC